MLRVQRNGLFFAGLLLAGCGTLLSGRTIPASKVTDHSYHLQSGDELEIFIYGRTENTLRAQVREDGTLLYPSAGIVQAGGRTIRDLEAEIGGRLNPDLSEELPADLAAPGLTVLSPREAMGQSYLLQSGDLLDVFVWDYAGLSQKVQIREDGAFSYPLIGEIQAAGKTLPEIQHRIQERLDKDYLVNPQVTVSLLEARFFVLAQKGESGSHSLEGAADLLSALSKAGDILTLRSSEVQILRRQEGKQVVINSNVDRVLSGKEPNLPILPRDTLYIKLPFSDEKQVSIRMVGAKFTALGEISSPGSYTIEGTMDLLTAVSLAGGITKFGSSAIEIIRAAGGEKLIIRASVDRILEGKEPNIPILPRDTLYVKRRLF